MATNGEVNITILDGGGSIVVPGANVQLAIGCCSAGTANQLIATTQISALTTAVGYGPGPEASALSLAAGGVVLFIKATQNALGTSTAVAFVGTGTSVITVTLDGSIGAFDDYNVVFRTAVGGTRGVAGVLFQISFDAGRTFGPNIALGTATSYAIPNTGITLNFAAGTFVALDTAKFTTTAPSWTAAGIQSALNAFAASAYASAGVGTMHIVGASVSTAGAFRGAAGADCTSIQGYLDTLVTQFSYNRAIVSLRDSLAPTAFSGAGETDATWTGVITADVAAVSAKRICAVGGYYNTQSQIPTSVAGAPKYRRPLAWSLAARQVTIPTQRHAGRVRDGSLSFIVQDPVNDPRDGFNYHDDALSPTLDVARLTSARQRKGLPGFYITNPRLLSPAGSDFDLLPKGLVMDVACTVVHQAGQISINDDLRTNSNGTLYGPDAITIQNGILTKLKDATVAKSMCSAVGVVVDQTNNVQDTSSVNIAVTVQGKAYVLEEQVTIGFGSVAA